MSKEVDEAYKIPTENQEIEIQERKMNKTPTIFCSLFFFLDFLISDFLLRISLSFPRDYVLA